MHTLRPAAVAGLFYPNDAQSLRDQVANLLRSAEAAPGLAKLPAAPPKALIAPHAGYIYSGPIAAHAYGLIAPFAARIQRVVLLGPAHRVAVRGLALPEATHFQTPLGLVEIDAQAVTALRDLPQVTTSRAAHALEHSLEVHLPFLQALLPQFRLIPLVVGDATAEEVAQVLERLWGGEETVIVASSDLSHYLPYVDAQKTDRNTATAILELRSTLDPHQACGAYPINGLLRAAARHRLRAHLIDLRNSGDTAGDRSHVVGYAAFAFYPASNQAADGSSDEERGESILATARSAIGERFGLVGSPAHLAAFMQEHGACFVTLTKDRQLRGCIGTLEAVRPLVEDVRTNACAAAFGDPRFPPITLQEFKQIRVEVSLLSSASEMKAQSEADAIGQLRPGIDGVVLRFGVLRSTFLPQVWDQLPQPAQFLAELKRKARLPADFWSSQIQLSRYTVTKWREAECL
ncbi:MAG TPA: AmmeMemoRadiSam system protein B [Burkholderiales bacterium]|nr:AmmeMemoRadiSam system protein B [Burkholderiales bacterium]